VDTAQLSIWQVALGNLHQVVPSPWSEAICVLIAFLCGAIVGFERERGHKPAGLRTQILICVGSAIFTVISMSAPLGGREPARIAAQIVAGVGFLGAGSIMRDRYQITGLTTAATIWTVSALGIVAGAGYVTSAVALSLAVYVVLASFRHAELLFAGRCSTTKVLVVYRAERGKTRALIMQALDESHGPLCVTGEAARPDGLTEMSVSYCNRHKDHRAFLATLAGMPAVEALEESAAECQA
jgi:putative Mg2+ transporter-C (MgtC) family protein